MYKQNVSIELLDREYRDTETLSDEDFSSYVDEKIAIEEAEAEVYA